MWNENYRSNFDYPRLAWDLGFSFVSHTSSPTLDSGKLNLIDVDKIIVDRDTTTVERNIPLIVQFKLDPEHVKILDPNFVKIFRLCQLSVEYLIFCKKYLDNTVVLVRNDYTKLSKENNELHAQIDELTATINDLKEQINKLESESASENVTTTFKCEHCHKVFATEDYLNAHIRRRHDVKPQQNPSITYQEETNKLQLEIKALKERLNSNERFVQYHMETSTKEPHKTDDSMKKVMELQQKFDNFKTLVETEMRLFETHKNFQEKYEKLIEISLRTIKSDKNVGDYNVYEPVKAEKKADVSNHGTQTVDEYEEKIEIEQLVYPRIMDDPSQKSSEPGIIEEPSEHFDFEKLQQRLAEEACQQIEKVESELEKKLSGRLEKIESQIDTFLDKLNQVEEVKVYSALEIINKMEDTEIAKPSPVHKTKSTPDLFVNNINTEIEKPKRIKRKMEVASDSVISKPGSKCVKDLNQKLETIKQMRSSNSAQKEKNNTHTKGDNLKQSPNMMLQQANAIKSKPSIREMSAEEEVLQKLDCYLLEIGVSPNWTGLPEHSYVQALEAVRQRAAAVKKTIPVYTKIRQKIMCTLKKEVDANMMKIRRSASSASTEIAHRKVKGGKQIQKKRSRDDNDIIREQFLQRNVMYSSDTDSEIDFMFKPKLAAKRPPHSTVKAEPSEKEIIKPTDNFAKVVQELRNVSQWKRLEERIAQKSDTSIDGNRPLDQKLRMKSALKNHPPPSPPPEPAVKKKVLFAMQGEPDGKVEKEESGEKTTEGGSSTSVTSSFLDDEFDNDRKAGKGRSKLSDISDWDSD